jgi:hypothetical protein
MTITRASVAEVSAAVTSPRSTPIGGLVSLGTVTAVVCPGWSPIARTAPQPCRRDLEARGVMRFSPRGPRPHAACGRQSRFRDPAEVECGSGATGLQVFW